MMESHPKATQLSRLALTRSAGAQTPALHAHIARCTDCQRLAALFAQVVLALWTAAPAMALPPPVKERVITRLRGGQAGEDWAAQGRPAAGSGHERAGRRLP